jgi:membrane protease YdiL (CAAX protease family)
MTLFDDNPNTPAEQMPPTEPSRDPLVSEQASAPSAPLTGDPISYAATLPAPALASPRTLPEDLRISWSWPHFLIFVLFGLFSQVTIAVAILGYYSAARHFTEQQMKHVLEDPKLLVGTNVLWFGLVMLFLYITLGVLRGLPFWRSLGWRKLNSSHSTARGRPWMYFFAGCALAFFVAVVSSQVKSNEHMPIQDLFKNRTGALLLMAMAVFVAPLVEETVFRGYLYPFLAGKFSRFAEVFGVDSSRAVRAGSVTGIFVTGILFGLLHGSQLGWTWGLVSLLTLVGVIFTFARAWTGTVFASFLLHLGYNSMIAVTSLIATRGFTHMPPGS